MLGKGGSSSVGVIDMKIIRDAIHENIELNDLEVAILDTPEMQRMRFVKQLALTHLVYPSANHTRFEHSLGTLHLTKLLTERLFEDDGEKQLLRLSALLHDVGHSAFSHLPEELLLEKIKMDHEQLGEKKILSGNIANTLQENGIPPKELLKIHQSSKEKSISSELGTDRMDYLLRDAYFTGVGYSLLDAQRLLLSLTFEKSELMLQEKGLLAAESLLVSRYLMFNAVYNHHAVRIASAMLEKALRIAIERKRLAIMDLVDGTDESIFLKLKNEQLIQAISKRDLFKTAFDSQTEIPQKGEQKTRAELEAALGKELDTEQFVISMPKQKMGQINMHVLQEDGRKYKFDSESLISRAVALQRKASGLIVACNRRHSEKVKKICTKFF